MMFLEFDSIAVTRGTTEEGLQCRRLLSELLLQLTYQQQQNHMISSGLRCTSCLSDSDQESCCSSIKAGEIKTASSKINTSETSCSSQISLSEDEKIGENHTKNKKPINRVIVVAATNRLQDIDEAIIRRFDTKVWFFTLLVLLLTTVSI